MAANLAEARSHNVPPEVFLRHYREIRELKDAHADAGMAVARAKKAAKLAGIDLGALKQHEALTALDTDEAELRLRNLKLYLEWTKSPIGTQSSLFGQAPSPSAEAQAEQRDWSAADSGAQAGRTGELRVANPYPPGSSQHVAYDKAWTKGNKTWLAGQGEIAADLGRNAGVESTAEPETVTLPHDDSETPPKRARTSRERRVAERQAAATTNGQDHHAPA